MLYTQVHLLVLLNIDNDNLTNYIRTKQTHVRVTEH